MNNNLTIIGKRLQYIREHLGLSRKEMQERYKVSASTIKSWESGKTEAGVLSLAKYLSIFKEHNVHISLDKITQFNEDIYYFQNWFDKAYILKEPNHQEIFDLSAMELILPSLLHTTKREIESISNSFSKAVTLILQEKEELFHPIFDNIPIKMCYKDDKNNIVGLNAAAAEAVGRSIADCEGRSAYDLFPEAMAQKYYRDDLEVLSSNTPKFNIIEEFEIINGTRGWSRTAKIPFFSKNMGKPMILAINKIISVKKNDQ